MSQPRAELPDLVILIFFLIRRTEQVDSLWEKSGPARRYVGENL
jgi:hypothetical protein